MRGAWACAALLIAGCGGRQAGPTPSQQWADRLPTQDASPDLAAKGVNDLAFELLKTLPLSDQENVFFSPLSIATTFGLFAQGAEDPALHEALNLLHAGSERSLAESQQALLVQCLKSPARDFNMANSVWSVGTPIKQVFAEQIKNLYGASSTTLAGGDIQATINDWGSNQTKGRIPKLLESVDPNAFLYFVNAVTFDGMWLEEFDRAKTKTNYPFHLDDGRTVPVTMMTGGKHFVRLGDNEDRIARTQFKDSPFALILYQPAQGTPLATLRGLDAQKWTDLLNDRGSPTRACLPRFKLGTSYDLKDTLIKAHKDLFDRSGTAKVLTQRLEGNLTSVTHAAMIEVDEEGVRAAAATGAEMTKSAGPFPTIFDRPFALIVCHVPTRSIAFVGVVHDPSRSTK